MIVLITGVSGSGKTLIGQQLAATLGFAFFDADDYHRATNIAKMSRVTPFSDADREPWLQSLVTAIDGWLQSNTDLVLACSALRKQYRATLLRDPSRMRIVYLKVPPSIARERVRARTDHFMRPELVESQFQALEEPTDAITIDATVSPETAVAQIRQALGR